MKSGTYFCFVPSLSELVVFDLKICLVAEWGLVIFQIKKLDEARKRMCHLLECNTERLFLVIRGLFQNV